MHDGVELNKRLLMICCDNVFFVEMTDNNPMHIIICMPPYLPRTLENPWACLPMLKVKAIPHLVSHQPQVQSQNAS
jgi:hypothetical protein